MSCEFCENADFGCFRAEVDEGGAHISLAGGCSRFPKEEQFSYCPVCGEALTEPEPLTLEELREMNGEPVWIVGNDPEQATWGLVDTEEEWVVTCADDVATFDCYGPGEDTWLAYRRPPKGAAP